MVTDEELLKKVEEVTASFRGRADYLAEVIGMIFLGRLMGWRAVRLIMPHRCWYLATKLFGDPKQLMPERGQYAHKSLGLSIVDKLGGYWDFIKGTREALPLEDRKSIL